MKIRDILASKGRQVHQVAPTDSIVTAIESMAAHDIGSLMVIDGEGEIQGIVTERDCLRVVARGPGYRTQTVESITTSNIAIAEIEDDLRHVVNTMVAAKCRHVPVVEDGKLAGMISVRDVINSRLNEARTELKFLRTYIQGPTGPGG